jgi:hypothetical protein
MPTPLGPGVRQLLDTFNSAPAELPTAAATRLAAVLTDFTGVPEAVLVRDTGGIRRRSSHLEFSATIRRPWPFHQLAAVRGHAWCVGTGTDLMTTYVGTSALCAERLPRQPCRSGRYLPGSKSPETQTPTP